MCSTCMNIAYYSTCQIEWVNLFVTMIYFYMYAMCKCAVPPHLKSSIVPGAIVDKYVKIDIVLEKHIFDITINYIIYLNLHWCVYQF